MENPERKKIPRNSLWRKGNWGEGKSIFYLCLMVFILLGTLGAGILKKGSEEMEVVGKVYLMGNEPFAQVAIETKDGQVYVLLGEQTKELRHLQGRRVSVVGKPNEEKIRGAQAIQLRAFELLKEK